MERIRRLRELWAWLPAFRAAAETGHLPTAADQLHVGASSISRTVRLLEDSLGVELFDRGGRAIRLNRSGQTLLAAVRDAMRIMDEGIAEVSHNALRGPVHLALPGYLASALAPPVVAQLAAKAPELVVQLPPLTPSHRDELLQGRLDAAVAHEPSDAPDITAEPLGVLDYAVYAGSRHPLASADQVSSQELATNRFAAAPHDGWPLHRPRLVGARAPDPAVAAALCADSQLLAVLPSVLASSHGLVRLACAPLAPGAVYLLYRRPVAEHARTNALLDAVRCAATCLGAEADIPTT